MAKPDDQGVREASADSDGILPVVCPVDDPESIRSGRFPHPHPRTVDALDPTCPTVRLERITGVDWRPTVHGIQTDPHLSESEAVELADDASPATQDRRCGPYWCDSPVYPTRWRHRGSIGGARVRGSCGREWDRSLVYSSTRAEGNDNTEVAPHEILTREVIALVTTGARGPTFQAIHWQLQRPITDEGERSTPALLDADNRPRAQRDT